MCPWLLFQPFLFLSWFSSFTVVFLIFLETSLCAAREFESHIPLLIIRNRQNCFFVFAVERWTWIQILKTQSMFNQCFVIVMPFVSNRIAPVVLHVFNYTYKCTRQRRYSTDSKSLHRQSMCSQRVLWKEGSKGPKWILCYTCPFTLRQHLSYGRLLRRALHNVPCKHVQAKFVKLIELHKIK